MSQLANTSRYLIDIAIYRDYRDRDISRYIDISIKTKSIRYRNRFQINIAIFDNIVISPKLTARTAYRLTRFAGHYQVHSSVEAAL